MRDGEKVAVAGTFDVGGGGKIVNIGENNEKGNGGQERGRCH